MSENKIKKLTPLIQTKFLSMYDVEYKDKNNNTNHWTVASRKNEEDLKNQYFNNKPEKVDAAIIAAFHKVEKKLVMIRQFRVPLNDYVYELPAGLVDNEEKTALTVARELKEETGLTLIDINNNMSIEKVYLSPGMTDESASLIYCLCEGEISNEYLEPEEDIEAILVSQEDAVKILNENKKIDIKAYMILRSFIKLGESLFI